MRIFKSKKEAIASINERTRKTRGVEYPLFEVYIGMNMLTKKPERLYASSKAKLLEMIDEFYKSREEAGDFSTALTPEQIVDARAALRALADARLDISLTECVKREIGRSNCVTVYSTKLGEAYDDFIDSKSLNSELELSKTECTSGKFVGMMGRDRVVASITTKDIAEYLHTNFDDKAPKTYNSHASYIRTFLAWCASDERKIIPSNPALPIKMKPVAWKRPEYMKVEFVRALFDLLWEVRSEHPEYLALATVQFFTGARRQESIRFAVGEENATLLIEDETLRIDGGKGATKGVAPRTVHLEANAVAWMKSFDFMSAVKLITEGTTRDYYEFARANGIPMFKNCARHSFITYHVAKYHTPEVTQSMVGTSGTMRAVHYDGLAPQREGEAYFGIFPPAA